jgi:hypothetical protein
MENQTAPPSIEELRSDPDFLSASHADRSAYLSEVDKDFAEGTPSEQAGFLDHVQSTAQQPEIADSGGEPKQLSRLNAKLAKALSISQESIDAILKLGLEQPAITKLLSKLSRTQILAMAKSDTPLVRRHISKESVAKASLKRKRL